MPFWKNKLIIASLIGLLVTVVFLLLAHLNFFAVWQIKFADNLYTRVEPSNEIIIVTVDDASVDPFEGLGRFETWDRGYYAKAIENINKYDPQAVALDFFLRDPRTKEGDEYLSNVLSETKNPIIGFWNFINNDVEEDGYFISYKENPHPYSLFSELENVTIALTKAINDPDDVYRRMLPGIYDRARDSFNESLAFAIARKASGAAPMNESPGVWLSQYEDVPLEAGQMLINFATKPVLEKTYATISFKDVYNETFGTFDPNFFRDKIVLIGATAIAIDDLYFTPTHKEIRMPGVEIHANALQTILEQRFLRNMTLFEQFLLLLVLSLATAFVFVYTKIRWSLLTLVAVPSAYAFAAPVAFNNGLILDLVHPYLAIASVFVASYMYRYFTEFKEKLQIRGAFAKYVSPKIVEQISKNPEALKLGGEKRNVTVMFTDIAHFTSISEQLKPESLVALLNEYFDVMGQVIKEEGGTLDKFEGDAIMAFFGAPIAQEDHALRACNTASKMRARMAELNEKWANDPPLPGGETKPQIDFRCGLSTGEVIVGNIGSKDRFDYTVMGDIVNLGSRLEGANKKYDTRIMVSEATWTAVKDAFEGRELDTIKVVGKDNAIKVYELIAPKGQLDETATTLLAEYNAGIKLYHERKFAEALEKFTEILKKFTDDGPSKLYRQRCEVLRDYPPPENWDGVFEMGSK